MKKTLIWEIINAFSQKEIKDFDKFLSSPYFNTREDLSSLNRHICQFIKKGESPTKEKLFLTSFPDEVYNNQRFRLLLSYLHKLVEKFLWIEKMDHAGLEKGVMTISSYREKKAERNFNRIFNELNKSIKKQDIRNPDFYFTRFQLEYQNYLFISEKGRSKELNLEKVERFLDIAYISTKLRQACFTLSHQSVFNVEYDTVLFEHILELAQKQPYKNIPSVALYYNFIVLFQKGGIIEFERFKQQLFQQDKYFKKEEFRDIYLLSLNFCIKKINENQKTFFEETLDMYKKGLGLALLFENNKISRFTYNNIVGIALRLNDLEWLEQFIHKYKSYLEESYKMAVFSLNMARLEFAKANFNKAQVYLQDADYQDLISNITAKVVQLKIYYELEEYDSLDSLIQSLRVFIRRKRRIGYHYHLWKNILHYIQKIRKVNPYDKEAILLLKEKIRQEKLLPEQDWLLAKLE